MKEENKAFMVRLRPSTRELLDRAADDQRRSRASIIDGLIREAFGQRYSNVNDRLKQMLGGRHDQL